MYDLFLTIAAEISQVFKSSDEFSDSELDDFNSKTVSVLISLAVMILIIVAKIGMVWMVYTGSI